MTERVEPITRDTTGWTQREIDNERKRLREESFDYKMAVQQARIFEAVMGVNDDVVISWVNWTQDGITSPRIWFWDNLTGREGRLHHVAWNDGVAALGNNMDLKLRDFFGPDGLYLGPNYDSGVVFPILV